MHVRLPGKNARGFGQRHIRVGSDVIRVRRQIDLVIVAGQQGDSDILRYVSLRIKFERDRKVGFYFFAVRMQVRAETDFRAGR